MFCWMMRQCLFLSLMMTNWLPSAAKADAAKPRTRAAARTYFTVMGFLRVECRRNSHKSSKACRIRSAQYADKFREICEDGPSFEGPGGSARQRSIQGLRDQRSGLVDAVKLDERAEAGPLGLAEEHLVKGAEPVAQRLKAVLLADRIDLSLDRFGERCLRQLAKTRIEIDERRAILVAGRAIALGRLHEVMEVADGVTHELVEKRVLLRRGVWRIAADEAPQHLAIL